jgi:CxxC motif-containing protein (DUF1111 family)
MFRKTNSDERFGLSNEYWLAACCLLTATFSVTLAADRRHRSNSVVVSRDFYEGKELFEKIWQSGKPSPFGGDGLGPLYNEDSCVACHHQGGTGGGGPNERNVLLLTAVVGSAESVKGAKLFQGEIEDLHPGFRNRASIVLHRHATDAAVEARLEKIGKFTAVQTREEIKLLRTGSRNTPALFGAGLIDAITAKTLHEAEKRSFPTFPEIKGRVSVLPDGRLGRFGWKAQIASLDDFVRAACSNELGLEVPGQHQASIATTNEFNSFHVDLDMDEEQLSLLTSFVGRLSPPVRRTDERTLLPWGYSVFQSIGCATCHAPKLGPVTGIFSDLLLHDMGEDSSDSATYYGAPIAPRSAGELAEGKEPVRRSGMAAPTEWRTPPLWGVASSAPYLHDGRAATLDDAIRRHNGEAAKATARYGRLNSSDRRSLIAFLSSLTVTAERKKSLPNSRTQTVNRSTKPDVDVDPRGVGPNPTALD